MGLLMAWKKAGAFAGHEAHEVAEVGRDFVAGLKPAAMPAVERRVSEFRIVAGTTALVAGVLEMGPFALALSVPAALEPAIEGFRKISHSGHALRAAQIEARLQPSFL